MQIDKEFLEDLKKKAEAERAKLLALSQQATGMIAGIDAMLERLAAPEPEAEEHVE